MFFFLLLPALVQVAFFLKFRPMPLIKLLNNIIICRLFSTGDELFSDAKKVVEENGFYKVEGKVIILYFQPGVYILPKS